MDAAGGMTPAGPRRPRAAIISPTRNESRNVDEFVKRTVAALQDRALDWEIVFADDSDDDTPAVVDRLARTGLPVRYVHRRPHERQHSIAGAVRAALATVDADCAVVIDADLQHPPEILPFLIGPLLGGADFVVGTRYAGAGSAEGLGSPWRRLASRATGRFTQVVFPQYWRCTDMASGLFAFRVRDFETGGGPSCGFKLLPEAMVRCDPDWVAEIPYTFEERADGLSKASVRDGFHLARALLRLRVTTTRLRPVRLVVEPADLVVPLDREPAPEAR